MKKNTLRDVQRSVKTSGKRSLLGIPQIRRAVRLVLKKRKVSSKIK